MVVYSREEERNKQQQKMYETHSTVSQIKSFLSEFDVANVKLSLGHHTFQGAVDEHEQ